jgi:hypothetical protein
VFPHFLYCSQLNLKGYSQPSLTSYLLCTLLLAHCQRQATHLKFARSSASHLSHLHQQGPSSPDPVSHFPGFLNQDHCSRELRSVENRPGEKPLHSNRRPLPTRPIVSPSTERHHCHRLCDTHHISGAGSKGKSTQRKADRATHLGFQYTHMGNQV